MELWVRAQDRETLLKVNNGLMYWEDTDKRNCIVIKETSTNLSVLGTYKTKERCLQVLDEIQNILKPKYILDSSSIKPDGDSWVENGVILQNYAANAKIEELSTCVYEMPLN